MSTECQLSVGSQQTEREGHKGELANRSSLGTIPGGCGRSWQVSTDAPRGPRQCPCLLEGSKLRLIISAEGNTLRKGKKPNGAKKKYRTWEKRLPMRKNNWDVQQ